MKNKWMFLLLGCLLVPIGFATFVINDEDDGNYKLRSDDSLVKNESSIILDYNDGETNPYVYPYTTNETVGDLPVPTVGLANHAFLGWYSTKTGIDKSGNSTALSSTTKLSSFDEETTIYARYFNSNSISSNITQSISLSKNSLYSDSSNVYYLGSSSGASSITIASSGSISVLYGGGSTYNSSSYGTDYTVKLLSEADIIVRLDCDLIISGGSFQLNSLFGYDGSGMGAAISGDFTCLDLNGYTITINNGGNLYGYGIIYNSKDSGGIAVENGTITTCFSPFEFSGGGQFMLNFHASVTPFYNYACPYLCCELIISPLGTITAFTSLYTSYGKTGTTFTLIGAEEGAMLYLKSGYIIRRSTSYDTLLNNFHTQYNYTDAYSSTISQYYAYDIGEYRESYIFTNDPSGHLSTLEVSYPATSDGCEVTFTPLTMKMSSYEASMQYSDFPIPSFMNLEFYDAFINVVNSLVFLPGSTCYIDEESIVYMTNNVTSTSSKMGPFARIYTLDTYPLDLQITYLNSDKDSTKSNVYAGLTSFHTYSYLYTRPKAVINMNGTFQFDSTNVDKNNGYYNWYNFGGNINLSDKALSSLLDNYQCVELATRFGFPYRYSPYESSTYALAVAQFYTSPLISNGTAYFQPSGAKTNIVASQEYNDTTGLFKYNGSWYYYKFDRTCHYGWCTGQVLNNAVYVAAFQHKMQNFDGSYVACQGSSIYSISGNQGTGYYIKDDDGNYRVNVTGSWIALSQTPSVDSSTGNINSVAVNNSVSHNLVVDISASGDINNSTKTNNNFYGIFASDTVYFETTTNHWRMEYSS